MCIAILKPKGQTLKMVDLEECWDNNSDGAGLMFAHEGKLIVRKGWMKWKNFQRAWDRHDLTDKTVALHFRISTGGRVNQANCHPYLINSESGVMHNGIFSAKEIPIIDDNYSDTCHFVRTLRDLGNPEFLKDPTVRKWIHKVAVGSKLIFMRADGTWEIINSKQGDWDTGSWYSNTTYKYPMFYETYEPWGRNPLTGTWEKTSADSRCDMCNLPLLLETERACDICELCIMQMYNDVRNESDRVYADTYPLEYDLGSSKEEAEIARKIAEDDALFAADAARTKRIHEEGIEGTWIEERDRRLAERSPIL